MRRYATGRVSFPCRVAVGAVCQIRPRFTRSRLRFRARGFLNSVSLFLLIERFEHFPGSFEHFPG